MKPILKKTILAAGMAPILSACITVGPDYEPPTLDISDQWAAEISDQPSAAENLRLDWWRSFDDPVLTALVERAAMQNLDLRVAEARLREARAARGVARADRYPSIEGGPGYERQRFSENTPIGRAVPNNDSFDLFSMGFDALWEVDIFGGVRRQVEAADARLQSAEESLRDVRLSVIAETARNYFELQAARSRLERVVANAALQRQTVELTQRRVDAGSAPRLDLDRALSQLQTLEAEIPTLQAQLPEIAYRIAVLVGDPPEAGLALLPALADADEILPDAPVGARSDILRRRPDVRRAERELAAATADKGVAVANLYPSVTLGGTLAFESMDFSDALEWSSAAWGVGPSVRAPIFEGGRLRALVRQADARIQMRAAEYEKYVLVALQEAEGAMVRYVNERRTLSRIADAQESSQRVVVLSKQRYSVGDIDLLSVIDAERQLVEVELRRVDARLDAETSLVALYKALGGGWSIFEPPEEVAGAAGEVLLKTAAGNSNE